MDIAKSMASTTGWASTSKEGTIGNDQAINNSSGFTALPGGARSANGSFVYRGSWGYWWSASEYMYLPGTLLSYYMIWEISVVERTPTGKQEGNSVRCVKDNYLS